MTEADTCREFVTPKLVEAAWGATESVIGEQHSFTNGQMLSEEGLDPVPTLAAQQTFGRLQAEVSASKAKHLAIREANAAPLPAALERIFQSEATA